MNMKNKIQHVCKLILPLLMCYTLQSYGQIRALNGKSISDVQMNQFLKKEMDSIGIPGLSIAVINNGKILYHSALGIANVDTKVKVDDQSIFEAASMSKPVFAYLVMRMVDKGLLNLDTPLYRYMPYPDIEKDQRYKLITARMVLTHRTGFPNWRWFNRADSSLHVHFPDLYLKFTPGTQYSYSGEGFLYLAKVVAYLNGKDLQSLEPVYEKEVAVPFHMDDAWFTGNSYITKHKVTGHVNGKVQMFDVATSTWPISFPKWDSTYFNPAASLHTDVNSYANFVINWMSGKGLSKSSFDEMLKPQYELPPDTENPNERASTGLGVFITNTPYGTRYQHGGNNGNFQSNFVWYSSSKNGYVYFMNCNQQEAFEKRFKDFFSYGK